MVNAIDDNFCTRVPKEKVIFRSNINNINDDNIVFTLGSSRGFVEGMLPCQLSTRTRTDRVLIWLS